MQDQMNNPYYDDAYDNDFVKEAPVVKRGDKKASDDEDGKSMRSSPCKVLTSIQMILYQRKLNEKFERRRVKVCLCCVVQCFSIFTIMPLVRKRGPRKRKLDEMSDGLGSDLQPNQADNTPAQPDQTTSGVTEANGTANTANTNGTTVPAANGTVAASSAANNNAQQSQAEEKDGDHSTSDGEPNKKKRKKDKPVNPNHKIGPWTDEEEQRFLESMELYGRDWDKVRSTKMEILFSNNNCRSLIISPHATKIPSAVTHKNISSSVSEMALLCLLK